MASGEPDTHGLYENDTNDGKTMTGRRDFLLTAGAVAVTTGTLFSPLGVGQAIADTTRDVAQKAEQITKASDTEGAAEPRRLRLVNAHTHEKLTVDYWKDGEYLPDELNKINFLLRDFRANEVMMIDTDVIDYLHAVSQSVDTRERIQILSGYRSPKTNEMLRKRSNGVAKNSMHIIGKAIDFRIPGQSTRSLQKKAMSLHRGGIGYYRRSDFVHIDSGPYRHWG